MRTTDFDIDFVGSRLFGSAARFRLMMWIAGREDPRFYIGQYTGGTSNPGNHAKNMQRLVDLRMVKYDEEQDHGACKWFVRIDSSLWDIVLSARELWLGRSIFKLPNADDIEAARARLEALETALR